MVFDFASIASMTALPVPGRSVRESRSQCNIVRAMHNACFPCHATVKARDFVFNRDAP
jgi:hypothetical protein